MSVLTRTADVDAPPVGAAGTPRRRGRRAWTSHVFLAFLVLYFVLPLWFLLVASTKSGGGLFNSPNGALWFGDGFHLLDNLRTLFTYNDGIYLRWLGNSLLYAIGGGVGATVLAVLAGYAFAKFDFPGRRVTFALLLGAVMVPMTALVIPTFVMLSEVGMTNTVWAVILPSMLSPFGVYLMRVYCADAVPDELLDAARMDGAGEFRVFRQVALPLMRPAVVTVLLLSVVGTWNNYFLPLAVLSDSQLFPVTVGINLWQGLAGANNGGGVSLYTLIIVGSLVSILPLIAAFLGLQRYWQGGLSIGSLK
ncbi:carbohydrate ABC transporter permease [uncultured Modestobacter sp.]|uniref:carbohydrate ABC transporter permease n=1 Tax=uncultured Modestobacter sp. TaxID=380048 RepID=UPI00261514EE|nr:carbohydrate ABC transporter permease [uncultured Modestobacter sp.]